MAARRILLPAILLLLGPSALAGQGEEAGPAPIPGASLRVSLITIGQGELVWERFGHNAILIEDEAEGWAETYHWGVFSFQQEDFIPRLIRGTMLYGMGLADVRAALWEYQQDGRPVWIQELALTPPQRLELLRLVRENYLPENRDYRYDYYRDNCSTRVRDVLDRVTGGRIRALFAADTTASTYRWHTRRILREMPLYYFGIQFVLGPNADHPITVWEEMFLPPTLMARIGEVQLPDGGGGFRSLVAEERVLLESTRPEPPSAPPLALPIFLCVGVLWGAALLWLVGGGGGLGAWRRLGVALLAGGWGMVAALSGTLLLGAWFFTDHFFWYANYNLFQVNPLFIPLPLVFALYLFRGRIPKWGRNLAILLLLLSMAGLVLQLVPGLGEKNGEILALTLPLNLALGVGTARLYRRGRGGTPARATEEG